MEFNISNHRDPNPNPFSGDESVGNRMADDEEFTASSCTSLGECIVGPLLDLVIDAISFHANLLINFFTLPLWLMHCALFLLIDPFRPLRWAWKIVVDRIQQQKKKLGARLLRGCLSSFYVLLMLIGLLSTAFFAGGLLMRRVAEEPVQLTQNLNFDYTKARPDAVVALVSYYDCAGRGLSCARAIHGHGKRFVPPNHELKLGVSLTLPESDYNRELGVFQVKAEFLSLDGQVLAASTQPCILRFKSSQIRTLQTFLRSGSLLLGHSYEFQVLNLDMATFTEGIKPASFVRVILEARAEYKAGVGIPQLYAASLKLESQVPLLKKIILSWRWTILIWASMGAFMLELFVVLLCFRPLLLPGTRQMDSTSWKKMLLQGKAAGLIDQHKVS